MTSKNVILKVDGNNVTFQKTFNKLDPKQKKEALAAFGFLFMMDTDQPPAKLHFHPLKNQLVSSVLDPMKKVKVYTIHISSDDTQKASFTLENGTAYFRQCGEHDKIDKAP